MKKKRDSDPLLDELDEVRQRIWDECDQDTDKYFAMLVEFQEQLRREGWKFVDSEAAEDKSAA
jgi:hypothetical protein